MAEHHKIAIKLLLVTYILLIAVTGSAPVVSNATNSACFVLAFLAVIILVAAAYDVTVGVLLAIILQMWIITSSKKRQSQVVSGADAYTEHHPSVTVESPVKPADMAIKPFTLPKAESEPKAASELEHHTFGAY
jgi:hypothetical protein